jgi:molecular chaperone DnaJ
VRKGSRTVTVTIPAGVDTDTRLRLAGQGDAGLRGGPPGDLYVAVTVRPDAVFERQGSDILCEIPVRFTEAALGATLRVPTLTGKADLKIPEGTQSGQLFRLRGLGLPSMHGRGKGDQIVRVLIEVPKRLTREQREIMEKFKALDDSAMYPKRHEFERRMKS